MSRIRVPRTKRQIRELVSIMSNLRPTASNKTDNAKQYNKAEIFNKIDKWWWYNTFADREFRAVFQAAAVTGTGYASHVWDPDFHGHGRGDIRTDTYDARSVYLIQPPRNHDLQKCYAVVIKSKVPLWQVQAKYPTLAHLIVPDHGTKAWTQKGLDYVQSFMSSPLKHLSQGLDDETSRDEVWPMCDVYETYIMDLTINLTGHEVAMGLPGSSWAYQVPAYGSQIPTGTRGFEGLPLYRKANEQDAKLYPMRRKMVATSNLILYDDTSEWWHGDVPLSKFTFDDWPWEALGFSLTRDVSTIENDANQILRGISDSALIALDPALVYDENLVSDRLAQKLNPRMPRQRLKLNMQMGDAIKTLLPANAQQMQAFIPDHVKFLFEQGDFLIGVRDLLAIAKAKQVPSADSLEKIMEMAGPLAQDMTRSMERGMRDLGEHRRWLNLQFRTTRRRMEILGENGITEEDFDYDPGLMVPSHAAEEDPEAGPSRYSAVQRARQIGESHYYHVVPNSMARLQQTGTKLLLLQLQKAGFPIDPWTLAEIFEVDNFGPPPNLLDDDGQDSGVQAKTVMERWTLWQRLLAELAQAGEGQKPQKGRPASGSHAPQIKGKSGNRTTVQQSR